MALLCVARVARTRFYEPPGMVAARLAAADPVVTSEPAGLRFESFSMCCGVHARYDALDEGLDATQRAPGTVNVDFNPPMREALARIVASSPLKMRVGFDAVEVETFEGRAVERRVPLPERWFKGFSEVQVAAAAMEPIAELARVEATRFLRSLPRGRGGRAEMWAQPAGRTLRLGSRPVPGAAIVAAPDRLRVLEPVARFIERLTVHGTRGEKGATTWTAHLPGGRLLVTLSPELRRGFSGEGGLLSDLVDETLGIEAEFLDRRLGDRWSFRPEDLTATGMSTERATRALSWLGAHGRLGFDPVAQTYFRRELPFPPEALASDPPRLRSARRLQADGAVRIVDAAEAVVASDEREYRVRLGEGETRCSCPWWSKHPGDRGPCKHLLAVAIERSLRADEISRPAGVRSAAGGGSSHA